MHVAAKARRWSRNLCIGARMPEESRSRGRSRQFQTTNQRANLAACRHYDPIIASRAAEPPSSRTLASRDCVGLALLNLMTGVRYRTLITRVSGKERTLRLRDSRAKHPRGL
jgi:hypothetical protein